MSILSFGVNLTIEIFFYLLSGIWTYCFINKRLSLSS